MERRAYGLDNPADNTMEKLRGVRPHVAHVGTVFHVDADRSIITCVSRPAATALPCRGALRPALAFRSQRFSHSPCARRARQGAHALTCPGSNNQFLMPPNNRDAATRRSSANIRRVLNRELKMSEPTPHDGPYFNIDAFIRDLTAMAPTITTAS